MRNRWRMMTAAAAAKCFGYFSLTRGSSFSSRVFLGEMRYLRALLYANSRVSGVVTHEGMSVIHLFIFCNCYRTIMM